MMQAEKGFTLIEFAISCAVIACIGIAGSTTIFQTIEGVDRSQNCITAIYQVENAGYWISHDTRMAERVFVENLEAPNFLILTWEEQNYDGGDSVHHSVTYFLEDLSGGVGKLKRNHWSSAGVNTNTLVASYIYHDPVDLDNTSKVSYQEPVLDVRLRAIVGDASETREYKIYRRPNFNY